MRFADVELGDLLLLLRDGDRGSRFFDHRARGHFADRELVELLHVIEEIALRAAGARGATIRGFLEHAKAHRRDVRG